MFRFFAAAAAVLTAVPAAAAPSGNWHYVMIGQTPDVSVAYFVDKDSIEKVGKKGARARTLEVNVANGRIEGSTLSMRSFDCNKPFSQTLGHTVFNAEGRPIGSGGVEGRQRVRTRTLNEWGEAYVCKSKWRSKTKSYPAASSPEQFAIDVSNGTIKLPMYRGGIWWIGNIKML